MVIFSPLNKTSKQTQTKCSERLKHIKHVSTWFDLWPLLWLTVKHSKNQSAFSVPLSRKRTSSRVLYTQCCPIKSVSYIRVHCNQLDTRSNWPTSLWFPAFNQSMQFSFLEVEVLKVCLTIVKLVFKLS